MAPRTFNLPALNNEPGAVYAAGKRPPRSLADRVRESRWGGLVKQYGAFCMVGLMGMAVDMLLLHCLASPSMLDWNLSLSKVIAAEIALIHNFLWNERWTFRGKARTDGSRAWLGRLARFNLICGIGIGFSVLLLNLQVRVFHWNIYLANFVAIVLVSVWNFSMSARFGWGTGGGSPLAEADGNSRMGPQS